MAYQKMFGAISWAGVPIMQNLARGVTSNIPFVLIALGRILRGLACGNLVQPVGSFHRLCHVGYWTGPSYPILSSSYCVKKRKSSFVC